LLAWFFGCLLVWLDGYLSGCFLGWLVDLLVGLLIGWLVAELLRGVYELQLNEDVVY